MVKNVKTFRERTIVQFIDNMRSRAEGAINENPPIPALSPHPEPWPAGIRPARTVRERTNLILERDAGGKALYPSWVAVLLPALVVIPAPAAEVFPSA